MKSWRLGSKILFERKIMEVKTEKFVLRPFKDGDAESMFKNINDPDIARGTRIPQPYTLEIAKKWVVDNVEEQKKEKKEKVNFVIEIDGEVAGSVGFAKIEGTHKAEFGYWLAKKYWGQGIMSEAAKIAVDYGFKEMNLVRIYASAYAFNNASMKVLEKAGFKLEGIARKDILRNGKYTDRYMYAKVR